MAPTKRKRRSKHRGTAAGAIQTRGRTGRPPTPEERKKQDRSTAREKRMNTPPTWRASIIRASIAVAILVPFVLLTTKHNGVVTAVSVGVVAMGLYVPGGYYIDRLMYRRRQRTKTTSTGTGTGK